MDDIRRPTPDVRRPTSEVRRPTPAVAANLKTSVAMSKSNNVNPGQYKVDGRLHPGDDSSAQEQAKEQASIAEHESREKARAEREKKRD
jgi:hypothetical protein